MDDRAIVPIRVTQERKMSAFFVSNYVQKILWNALQHETVFVHNYLRTQKHIPKVSNALSDSIKKDKELVLYVPENISYPPVDRCVIYDRDDDSHIHIDFEPDENAILSEEHFEHIRRMPEGANLCLCNILGGAIMLGGILILTFCR